MLDVYDFRDDIWLCHSLGGTCYDLTAFVSDLILNRASCFIHGLVGSMPLQFLEIGFHVEIHAIEWHDFQHETQIHGVVVA